MTRVDARDMNGSHAPERGFALLVVMLLAAAVAFSLYTQVPRVGFESMREKEQLLMDRGNQYKRAIQVFYAVNHRYPTKIEELENTNDKRFLRRRYRDPLTGKDEWRLIHTNGSYLTDSLVQKPPNQNAANGTPGAGILPGGGPLGTNNMNSQPGQPSSAGAFGAAFGGSTAGINNGANTNSNTAGINAGANGPGANGGVPTDANGVPQPVALNPAAQRRPSDRLIPGDGTAAPPANPQDPNSAGVYPPGYNPATFNPNDPSTWPPITLAPANTGQPGQPLQNGQLAPNGQPLQNGQLGQNGQPQQSGQIVPGGQNTGQNNPGIPGFGGQNALNGQPPVTQITPQPASQPAPGQPIPGFPFGPQGAPAADGSGAQQTQGQTNPVPAQGTPAQSQSGINPQPAQIFNPGFGFNGNPLAAGSGQQPTASPASPFGNPIGANQQAGNQAAGQQSQAALNPALQAINNQLSSPNTGPGAATNPQAAPGIAGVASTFEGVGIKIYHERSKYKEWEFVFDPAATAPAGQTGQNTTGQPGPNPAGANPAGSSGNLFGPSPNPFAPNSGSGQAPTGQAPASSAPATNPFAPTPGLFGQ